MDFSHWDSANDLLETVQRSLGCNLVAPPCPHHAHIQATLRTYSSATAVASNKKKHKLVFLGSPDFSAQVLRELFKASRAPGADFEVVAVVSRGCQPGSGLDHNQQSQPPPSVEPGAVLLGADHTTHRRQITPVTCEALSQGLMPHQVMCPAHARQEEFLLALAALRPDLAITAAYGCMLPQRFLDIPRLGTINIHPSLLPSFRGAAPVQRCLEAGHTKTGVSLVFTVLRCDAGPVLAAQEVELPADIQAPELTDQLFSIGSAMLIKHLPDILTGRAAQQALPQDESRASHAAKVTKDEGLLDLTLTATALHNKVRALAGWPGTRARFLLQHRHSVALTPVEAKVIRTRVITHAAQLGLAAQTHNASSAAEPIPVASGLQHHDCTPEQPEGRAQQIMLPGLLHPLPTDRVSSVRGHMLVPCGGHTILEVCEARFSGSVLHGSPRGPPLTGAQFMQGLAKRQLLLAHHQAQANQQAVCRHFHCSASGRADGVFVLEG